MRLLVAVLGLLAGTCVSDRARCVWRGGTWVVENCRIELTVSVQLDDGSFHYAPVAECDERCELPASILF